MKHGQNWATVAFAFMLLAISAVPADAAIGPPPFLSDLTSLRLWVLVVAVFFIFCALVMCGISVAGKRYGEAFILFVGIVIGGSIVATATGLTTGIAGGLGGGGVPT